MFEELSVIFEKPAVFEHSNSTALWNHPHISKEMLKLHLDPNVDPASRNKVFLEKSIDWMIRKFHIQSNTKILDLGCGPGLYASAFARMGADVAGIDVSENSIRYAREKAKEEGLSIEYINADYVKVDFHKKYDLIALIYCDYCVLNSSDRKTLLAKIFSALNDSGSFVFDVLSGRHFESRQENHSLCHFKSGGFWSLGEHFVFNTVYKYDVERTILEKNTVIEKNNRLTIYNYLKCFELDEIKNELSINGFKATELYGDIAGAPHEENSKEMALIAVKK